MHVPPELYTGVEQREATRLKFTQLSSPCPYEGLKPGSTSQVVGLKSFSSSDSQKRTQGLRSQEHSSLPKPPESIDVA